MIVGDCARGRGCTGWQWGPAGCAAARLRAALREWRLGDGVRLGAGVLGSLRKGSVVFALLLGGCAGGAESKAEDDALVELCERTCLAPLCDGAVDPAPGFGQMCQEMCAEEVARVGQGGCVEAYSALHECLEALSCEHLYEWLEHGAELAELPCGAEELVLAEVCPSIDLRAREDAMERRDELVR